MGKGSRAGIDENLSKGGTSSRFTATVLVLIPRSKRQSIKSNIPSGLNHTFVHSIHGFRERLSEEVAVTLLPSSGSDDSRRNLIRSVMAQSPHTHIGMFIPTNSLAGTESLPADVTFEWPLDDSFGQQLIRLYLRAYYSATLERYFELNISIQNHQLQTRESRKSSGDDLRRLERSAARTKSLLDHIRSRLTEEDLQGLLTRPDTFRKALEPPNPTVDPSIDDLPDHCPDCTQPWGDWDDARNGFGYRQIAARVWRCQSCGYVVANPSPDGYHVR